MAKPSAKFSFEFDFYASVHLAVAPLKGGNRFVEEIDVRTKIKRVNFAD